MPTVKTVLPVRSFDDAFTQLINMDEQEFAALVKLVAGPRSYEPDPKMLAMHSRAINLSDLDIRSVLGACRSLYDLLAENGYTGDDRLGAIEATIEDVNPSLTSERLSLLLNRLAKLLVPTPERDQLKKRMRLERGFLPVISNVTTYVDMRPDFVEDDSDLLDDLRVKGFVPVISLHVASETYNPNFSSVSYNLPITKIDDLIETLNRTKEKLEIIVRTVKS